MLSASGKTAHSTIVSHEIRNSPIITKLKISLPRFELHNQVHRASIRLDIVELLGIRNAM